MTSPAAPRPRRAARRGHGPAAGPAARRRGPRAALAAGRDRGGDRGASAVELAILGVVVIFVSMLIIEYGLWFDARHAALAAAQEGDLVARENAFTDPQHWAAQAKLAAESYYRGLDTSVLSRVTAYPQPGQQPNTVSVQVKGTLNGVIPLPISVTVTGPVECFRTQVSQGTACG
jgi:Flp pilus assembly protein TadG